MKISSMKYLVVQGIKNVWTNRVMSFASFCILMVSLLLVGFSLLFTANVNRFIGGIENKNEMIIFLKDEVTPEQVTLMEGGLKNIDNVSQVTFYSKEEAFEDMKKQYQNSQELFGYFSESPLPDAFKLKISDISKMSVTESDIKNYDNANGQFIYQIKAPNDFANILTELKSTIAIVSSTVVIALVVVSMVIISNATRTSVFSRRKEINIMKYVGATNAFIRIPFFIEGMFTGMLAGGVASLLTWFGYDSFIDVLSKEMTLWQALGIKEFIPFNSLAVKVVIAYVVAGAVLGAMGSVISTRKHLKV